MSTATAVTTATVVAAAREGRAAGAGSRKTVNIDPPDGRTRSVSEHVWSSPSRTRDDERGGRRFPAAAYFTRRRSEGLAGGLAAGQAGAVLLVLAQRGLDVSDDVRTRVTGCTDLGVLRLRLTRAITAPKAEGNFEDV
ncbi:hypothetical protein [Streptomyces sp. NEAU-W12]|uniref:hypothetical protein n=1 Tax=Streptomyces sp. NEAU-W12 TaxID=2994668 RepID=UPI00224A5145|nr:hypothetical protein [Streptomyces sp. NEAU-W12]MCX2925678.1 hypothetical protein [Streptomyces sp. NEAU-W12]